MTIKKPIFIIGLGRSGTTILYELFTKHKDTAFFEHFAIKYKDKSSMFKFFPILFKLRQWKHGIKRPKVMEGGQLWNKFYPLFEPLNASQATEEIKQYYYKAIETELNSFKAKRFVGKYPPNSINLPWLNEMFPDAFYILIWRDARASVCSMYTKMKQQENQPDPYNHWSIIRNKFGKDCSELEGCINLHKFITTTLLQDISLLKTRTIQLQYEDLIKNPRKELIRLYDFTELKWYQELENEIPDKLELGNDEKWKKLPINEKEILDNAFKE